MGSDARYDRVSRLLGNSLPLSAQLAKKSLVSFAADTDGFVLEQFFKMRACFLHEIAMLEGIDLQAADALLRQSPFLYCAAGKISD